MKAIILHGGSGTRLRPLTYTGSKQLIKIAGKPISQYGIDDLINKGIIDIGIILGDNSPRDVINYYGDGNFIGANITYIYQGRAMGLADAIYKARDFIGNDRFIVYLGDNIVFNGLDDLINFDGNSSILLSHVNNPQRFGVAEINGNKIIRLVEKPKEFISDLALVGVYAFDSSIFSYIEKLKPSNRNELEITEAIQNMITDGKMVQYSIIDSWWKDNGTPDDLLYANMRILDKYIDNYNDSKMMQGRIEKFDDLKLWDSKVYGPSYIGRNVTIKNSYIGPYTSINDNVVIEDSEIYNSLVFENSRINNSKINNSIIGEETIIDKNIDKPSHSIFISGKGSIISVGD